MSNPFSNWKASDLEQHNAKVFNNRFGNIPKPPEHLVIEPKDSFKRADGVARESELHDQIIAECRRRGFYYVHSRTDKRTTTAIGCPDFVVAGHSGAVWWIEVKMPKNKPTREQAAVGIMLNHLGQKHAVVHSLEEFVKFVDL